MPRSTSYVTEWGDDRAALAYAEAPSTQPAVAAYSIGHVLIHSASGHAIERYRERCAKEHLTFQEARKQLLELARAADFTEQLPAWCSPPTEAVDVAGFVVVADSLVLPVTRDGVVTTVLARGSSSPEVTSRRREGRRKRHGYLRAKSHGGVGPRRGSRPDPEWA